MEIIIKGRLYIVWPHPMSMFRRGRDSRIRELFMEQLATTCALEIYRGVGYCECQASSWTAC
jgi:hypothetical protein